jgi:hypothetical protein
MHAALLFVEKPDTSAREPLLLWQKFQGAVERRENSDEGIETLGESCWLIDRQKNRNAFVGIASAAQANQLRYRVLFVDNPPTWIHS